MNRERAISERTGSGTALLAITIVGAMLRCYHLGQNSLWIDEIASLETARERFWTIPAAAMRQNAFEPPLYFWLLHAMAAAFGDGEVALRVGSAIFGALTIPLVWLLIWELSRQRQVATLSAIFIALNPLHLWYSQEARPYAIMMFFGTGALLALAKALRQPSRRLWAMFALCTAIAMLTHAVSCVILAVGFLWVLLRPDRSKMMRPFLLSAAASLLLLLPAYLPLARAIATATGTGSPERPLTGLELPYTAFTYIAGYSFGPSVREIQDSGWRMAASSHIVQLCVAAAFLGGWLALVVVNRKPPITLLLILCALPAIVAITGSAATSKAYNVRYAVLGVVGFVASLSAALIPLRPPVRNAVATMFCVVFVWADVQWFQEGRFQKEDSRAAIAWLSARLPSNATVAVAPSYAINTLAHYVARSDSHLRLMGVTTSDDLTRAQVPDALVLTRRYHVDHWRDLVSEFLRLAGPSVEHDTEIGYTLLLRRSSEAGTSTSVTRPR